MGWLIVAKKELREMARDKRVASGAILGPLFVVVLFAFLFGTLQSSMKEQKSPEVAIVGSPDDPTVRRLTEAAKGRFKWVADRESGVKLMRKGTVRLVLVFPRDFGSVDVLPPVEAVFDPAETLSQIALSGFQKAFDAANARTTDQLLKQSGIDARRARPLRLKPTEDRKPEGLGGSALAGFLPYLIVLWAFYGVMSIVADLIAGERERGTLETLLVAPVDRAQIALGKLASLAVLSFMSSFVSFAGILLIGVLPIPAARTMFPEGIKIAAVSGLSVLVGLLGLVAMCSSLAMMVTARSKSLREAQTSLTLVSFLIMLPAVYSQFIGFMGTESALWVRWTPVLSSAILIKNALLGRTDWAVTGASVIAHCALAALFTYSIVRSFRSEAILAKA